MKVYLLLFFIPLVYANEKNLINIDEFNNEVNQKTQKVREIKDKPLLYHIGKEAFQAIKDMPEPPKRERGTVSKIETASCGSRKGRHSCYHIFCNQSIFFTTFICKQDNQDWGTVGNLPLVQIHETNYKWKGMTLEQVANDICSQ